MDGRAWKGGKRICGSLVVGPTDRVLALGHRNVAEGKADEDRARADGVIILVCMHASTRPR
jgi:hypothetical protein